MKTINEETSGFLLYSEKNKIFLDSELNKYSTWELSKAIAFNTLAEAEYIKKQQYNSLICKIDYAICEIKVSTYVKNLEV